MPMIVAVCRIMVPIVAHLRPQTSEIRGMKVAEKVHPIKKAIPMKAMVGFEAPKRIWI